MLTSSDDEIKSDVRRQCIYILVYDCCQWNLRAQQGKRQQWPSYRRNHHPREYQLSKLAMIDFQYTFYIILRPLISSLCVQDVPNSRLRWSDYLLKLLFGARKDFYICRFISFNIAFPILEFDDAASCLSVMSVISPYLTVKLQDHVIDLPS